MTLLKSQAIQTALTGDWTNAILLNQSILEEDPNDIDTLNRLAFAYASSGNLKEAKNVYEKVLLLDVQNPIALRNLKRLDGNSAKSSFAPTLMSNLFIEEPGKTKVVELINVAEKHIIAPLRSGEKLQLQVKRMKIFLLDSQKQYIGMLPDDIGNRLIKFIEGGNSYEAYVKTVDNNRVIVFVREVMRAEEFKHQPSFISTEKTKLQFDTHQPGKNLQQKNNSPKNNAEIDDDKTHAVSEDDESL